MNMWLRLLVEWYVRRCNEYEGHKKIHMLLDPRDYRLCGKNWQGKQIKVTVETIEAQEPVEEPLWVTIPRRLRP
jgi:hypothetical protein